MSGLSSTRKPLKQGYLLEHLVLVSPSSGQTIGLYLAVSTEAISVVMFRDDYEKPFYFINKKLVGGEPNYSKLKKVAFTFIHLAQRLKPYFQGRIKKVYTKYPLKFFPQCLRIEKAGKMDTLLER